MVGYGYYNNYYNNYDLALDDDKFIKLLGVSVGWGKRLRWPDDYFQLSATAGLSALHAEGLALLPHLQR